MDILRYNPIEYFLMIILGFVLKHQARNESDEVRQLKRKIEDNQAFRKELDEEERELLINALESQAEMLEKMASKPSEVIKNLGQE